MSLRLGHSTCPTLPIYTRKLFYTEEDMSPVTSVTRDPILCLPLRCIPYTGYPLTPSTAAGREEETTLLGTFTSRVETGIGLVECARLRRGKQMRLVSISPIRVPCSKKHDGWRGLAWQGKHSKGPRGACMKVQSPRKEEQKREGLADSSVAWGAVLPKQDPEFESYH